VTQVQGIFQDLEHGGVNQLLGVSSLPSPLLPSLCQGGRVTEGRVGGEEAKAKWRAGRERGQGCPKPPRRRKMRHRNPQGTQIRKSGDSLNLVS